LKHLITLFADSGIHLDQHSGLNHKMFTYTRVIRCIISWKISRTVKNLHIIDKSEIEQKKGNIA